MKIRSLKKCEVEYQRLSHLIMILKISKSDCDLESSNHFQHHLAFDFLTGEYKNIILLVWFCWAQINTYMCRYLCMTVHLLACFFVYHVPMKRYFHLHIYFGCLWEKCKKLITLFLLNLMFFWCQRYSIVYSFNGT